MMYKKIGKNTKLDEKYRKVSRSRREIIRQRQEVDEKISKM